MSGRIKDPLLDRVSVGADAEPPTTELLKERESQEGGRPPRPQTRRGGLLGIIQLLGPGLISGASDDDPSGIGTYSQVGSQFGYGMLWTALFTFPLMAAIQELCARIALQTGVGLGVALRRKFPVWLVGMCIAALLIANTINLGADLGAIATGGSILSRGMVPALWLVLPVAALILYLQFFVSYRRIFNTFKWLTLALFTYVFTAFLAHPSLRTVVAATFVPHIEPSRDFVIALVAVFGTTISPYLFFWQASAEVDEMRAAGHHNEADRRGVKLSELRAAQADVLIGMGFSQVVMYAIILTNAAILHAHGRTDVQTADQAAQALQPLLGPFAFLAFALGLIGTGFLAVPILSGSAAYAFKEFFGLKGDLGSKPAYRPTFYGVIAAATVAGVILNFLHIDPISALFYAAVINGVVAPPLMLQIVMLGGDRRFMAGRVSGWLSKVLTWIATAGMSAAALTLIVSLIAGLRA
jgi:NRAMP (natural resistance-associated macrophage protein)-like metal ion transporter